MFDLFLYIKLGPKLPYIQRHNADAIRHLYGYKINVTSEAQRKLRGGGSGGK